MIFLSKNINKCRNDNKVKNLGQKCYIKCFDIAYFYLNVDVPI